MKRRSKTRSPARKKASRPARSPVASPDENTLFLESILENIPDMIFVKDARDLRFVTFNRAGEELLGRSAPELIGRNDYDFFPKEEADFFTGKDRQVLAGKTLVDIPEEPIHTRSRGLRYLHTKKIPILGADGNPRYLLGISEDITERKLAQEALRRAYEDLEAKARERTAANQELEAFNYSVSHDLRGPLRAINGFSAVLLDDHAAELSQEARRFLGLIKSNSLQMSKLIDDLLSFSRLGRQEFDQQPVDMTPMAAAVAEELRGFSPERTVQVEIQPLASVRGDPGLLRQVWVNLISNAIKFSSRQPLSTINITSRVKNGFAIFCVKDNGIGFDMQYANNLFGVFQRLHPPQDFEGTGVGLAIVQRVIHKHGGKVWAESRPGEGAAFYFSLPLLDKPA